MGSLHRSRRVLTLALVLFAVLPFSAGALAQGRATAALTAQPATAIAFNSSEDGWDSRSQVKHALDGDALVSVIVKLSDAPLAAYAGTLPGLPATSPSLTGAKRLDLLSASSRQYLAYLDRRQGDFVARVATALPQARLAARYRYVFGGAAVVLPESQIPQLAALPGVVRVQRDELRHADTDRSPAYVGADVIWRALAADPALGDGGQGVIVGVIDTGVWPEHPSFADDGSYPPPPARWHGACEEPNDSSPPIVCNHKLIGARESLEIYKVLFGLTPGEFDSARDNQGHGTHTASTAAGNAGVPAQIFGQPRGIISGIAPRAYVAAYKALGNEGGFGADLMAAIDQAVADGVDVINYSIGSVASADPYDNPDTLAFLDAYRAGVFVAVSAGNAGPGPQTIGSPANAPWVMSVGASTTDRQFISQLKLRAGGEELTVAGASITAAVSGKPVINAATLNDARCERPLPEVVSGTIVLCQRGINARVEKSANVLAGGGAGMVLYNPNPQDVETDNHWVPTIHLDAPAGAQAVAFTTAHSNTLVLGDIVAGETTIDPAFGDIMAAFSSRGPLPDAQLGISKPDVVAPGVQILAGHTPEPNQTESGPPGELFQAIAGTSMSSPHVAGAGALLKALHPDWSPGQIKSALMTTAWTNVRRQDGATPAGPYDMGAGRIDLRFAGDPGLTFDIPAEQYASGKNHLSDLNYPSISMPSMPGRQSVVRVVHSVLPVNTTWSATDEVTGSVKLTINPRRINVPAFGDASFVVTVDAGRMPEGTYFGRILLSDGHRTLHMPVSFVRRQPQVALAQRCEPHRIVLNRSTTCTVTATNNGLEPATISIRDRVPRGLSVQASSVISATFDQLHHMVSYAGLLPGLQQATMSIAADPGGSPFGYVPLASLGIAPAPCDAVCDDVSITYLAPPFIYNGAAYDHITMTSNGYLIVGSATENRIFNQHFPDPTVPNNVIAPYWADLDLDGMQPDDPGGGQWYAAYVRAGQDSPTWFVAEWTNVAGFTRNPLESHHTFQAWIEGGSDHVYLVYGPNSVTEDKVTVGAENSDGTAGANYYVDQLTGNDPHGEGTPPVEGDELKVAGVPEVRSSYTFSFRARGRRIGRYSNIAEMSASSFAGINIVVAPVTIVEP